jgi:hypothetical protein
MVGDEMSGVKRAGSRAGRLREWLRDMMIG